jgi:hypothetical protein
MYSNGTLTKSHVISLDRITAGILDSGDVSVYFPLIGDADGGNIVGLGRVLLDPAVANREVSAFFLRRLATSPL